MDKKVAKKAYTILKKKIGFSKLEYKDQLGETTNYEIVADFPSIITHPEEIAMRSRFLLWMKAIMFKRSKSGESVL